MQNTGIILTFMEPTTKSNFPTFSKVQASSSKGLLIDFSTPLFRGEINSFLNGKVECMDDPNSILSPLWNSTKQRQELRAKFRVLIFFKNTTKTSPFSKDPKEIVVQLTQGILDLEKYSAVTFEETPNDIEHSKGHISESLSFNISRNKDRRVSGKIEIT